MAQHKRVRVLLGLAGSKVVCLGAWQQVRLGRQAGARSWKEPALYSITVVPSEELKHEAAVFRVMPGRAPPGCDVEDGFEEAFEVILAREGWVCWKERGGDRCGSRWQHVLSSFLLPFQHGFFLSWLSVSKGSQKFPDALDSSIWTQSLVF